MASGHRKRKAAAVRAYVLTPAGYSNASEADRGVTVNQNALINNAFYSKAGATPTFTNASTTLLSDAVSNADTTWALASLTGETTNAGVFLTSSMSGAVGILSSNTKHYYFPAIGLQTDLSSSGVTGPLIIYSNDGPQSSYVPYYQGGATTTASVLLGLQITGAGSPTHVVVYVGGQLATGDQIRLLNTTTKAIMPSKLISGSQVTSSNFLTTSATASAAELSAALYRKAFLIPTASIATAQGLIVEFSSSAKTSTTPVAGVFVAISSGSYP